MARLRMHLRRSTAHREHATQQALLEQGMSSVAPSKRRSFAGAPGVALPTPTGMLTGLVDVGGVGGSADSLAGAMNSVLGMLDEGLTVTGPVVEVPVLAAMVTGLEGLMPHQALWQFLAGRLVDAFDAEVEKYAVHKVGMGVGGVGWEEFRVNRLARHAGAASQFHPPANGFQAVLATTDLNCQCPWRVLHGALCVRRRNIDTQTALPPCPHDHRWR
jgi:hypothetical protein